MTNSDTGNDTLFEFMRQLELELYRRYLRPGPINPETVLFNPESVLLAVVNAIAEVRRKMTKERR